MEDCESEIVYVRGCKVVGVWICGEEVEEDGRAAGALLVWKPNPDLGPYLVLRY